MIHSLRKTTLFILTIILVSISADFSTNIIISDPGSIKGIEEQNYVTHEPIEIISDANFSVFEESGTETTIEVKCVSGVIVCYIDDTQKDTDDFSTVLDVPLVEPTYLTSSVADTPNSNSTFYTKLHTWEQL